MPKRLGVVRLVIPLTTSRVSKILLDQIRTIDKSRLGKQIGNLNHKKMEEVNEAIRVSLDV